MSHFIFNATRYQYVIVPSYDFRPTIEIANSLGWRVGFDDIFIERNGAPDAKWRRLSCPTSSVKKRSLELSYRDFSVQDSLNNHRDSVFCG